MSGESCQSGGDGGGDRYGKKQLEHMATSLASEDYLKDNARHCPHCNAPIEKNEGCNKITCWRCGTNFCWLCGAKLNQRYLRRNRVAEVGIDEVDTMLDDTFRQEF